MLKNVQETNTVPEAGVGDGVFVATGCAPGTLGSDAVLVALATISEVALGSTGTEVEAGLICGSFASVGSAVAAGILSGLVVAAGSTGFGSAVASAPGDEPVGRPPLVPGAWLGL